MLLLLFNNHAKSEKLQSYHLLICGMPLYNESQYRLKARVTLHFTANDDPAVTG